MAGAFSTGTALPEGSACQQRARRCPAPSALVVRAGKKKGMQSLLPQRTRLAELGQQLAGLEASTPTGGVPLSAVISGLKEVEQSLVLAECQAEESSSSSSSSSSSDEEELTEAQRAALEARMQARRERKAAEKAAKAAAKAQGQQPPAEQPQGQPGLVVGNVVPLPEAARPLPARPPKKKREVLPATAETLPQPAAVSRVEVCTGKSCLKAGALDLLAAVEVDFEATGALVTPCKCLGECKRGPVMRLAAEGTPPGRGTVFTGVQPDAFAAAAAAREGAGAREEEHVAA